MLCSTPTEKGDLSMRKEIYKIKCPKHIIFGDPQYFEEFKGAELKRLTVDYKPSEYFDTARLVLQEQPNQEFPDYMERSISGIFTSI